jgi:hypothetical protein
MNYSRPELLYNRPYSSIADRSIDPDWKVSGDQATALRMMYYLDRLTINVSWSLSYSFPPSPDVYYSHQNISLDSKTIPNFGWPCFSQVGYYYTDTNFARFPDPASRITMLNIPSNANGFVWYEIHGGVFDSPFVDLRFFPTFNGTNLQVASYIEVSQMDRPVVETGPLRFTTLMNNSIYPSVASTTLNFYGMSFPIYLVSLSVVPPIISFSTPFTVTGTIAFHPTS